MADNLPGMTIPDLPAPLLETYRSEAASLFAANQDARRAAERTAFFVLTLVGVAVATGISAHSALVALALSPLTLMLMSYLCQQYIDVTILGAGRMAIEHRVADALPASALICELAVSPARHSAPFSTSARILNLATGLVVAGAVAAGIVVALDGQRWYWEVAFGASTAISALSLAASFRDMQRAGRDAVSIIEGSLQSLDEE